jgi:hypothetical protein
MTAGPAVDSLGNLPVAQRIETVATWLRHLKEPGDVTELRAVNYTTDREGRYLQTFSGYFDYEHLQEMARQALRLTAHAEGVYFTLNPVNPDLLALASNRVRQARKGEQTADEDIVCRRLILIDADPKRPAGISSSDEEKAAAWQVIRAAQEYMASVGLGENLLADSGNGFHLLVPVSLPRDDGDCVRLFLQALAERFDTAHVKIDRKVYNPARICKLYGTLARKGDHTEKRPHRRSYIMEGVPE